MLQALHTLSGFQLAFDARYRSALLSATALGLPLLICTIYDQVPGLTPRLRTALSLFNDVILKAAMHHGLPVLDLRAVCTDAADYSTVSPIEPSTGGGEKIAAAIVKAVVGRQARPLSALG